MKSRVQTEEFYLWKLPTFRNVKHRSCSAAQAHLARSVHKAWLQYNTFHLWYLKHGIERKK